MEATTVIGLILLIIVVALVVMRLRITAFVACKSTQRLDGKVVIITGEKRGFPRFVGPQIHAVGAARYVDLSLFLLTAMVIDPYYFHSAILGQSTADSATARRGLGLLLRWSSDYLIIRSRHDPVAYHLYNLWSPCKWRIT